jgi:hypothetical protein
VRSRKLAPRPSQGSLRLDMIFEVGPSSSLIRVGNTDPWCGIARGHRRLRESARTRRTVRERCRRCQSPVKTGRAPLLCLTVSHRLSRRWSHSRPTDPRRPPVSLGQLDLAVSFATRRPRVQIPPAPLNILVMGGQTTQEVCRERRQAGPPVERCRHTPPHHPRTKNGESATHRAHLEPRARRLPDPWRPDHSRVIETRS